MIKLLLPFYLCWIIPTIVFYYVPLPGDISSFQFGAVVLLFIGMYLVLASTLAYRVMLTVQQEKKKGLIVYSSFAFLNIVLIYYYVHYFDHSSLVVASLSTANLLFLGSVLGAGLSSAVKRTGELVPICITAAFADLISVLFGPTSEMIEGITSYYSEGMVGPPPLVDFIIVKFGVPGFSIPMPLFGVTDWIFVVLLSTSLMRLKRSDNLFSRKGHIAKVLFFPVTAAALYLALVISQIAHIYIPAMVVISSIFLLFLLVKLRVHKEFEKLDAVYSLVFPAAVAWVIYLL